MQDAVNCISIGLLIGILAFIVGLNFKISHMANELDALKAAVEQNQTVTASAITLLQGLKQKLDEAIASGDPAKLHDLSAELGQSTDALAAAITANTPAS
jgi:hypothetical protein